MNADTSSHLALTATVMKEHGFKATVKGSRVEVSLRKRLVYPYEVMRVIEEVELPISASQLKYACGNTYIVIED